MSERNDTQEAAKEREPAKEAEVQPVDEREAELSSLLEKVEEQQRRIDELARAYADALNERESFRRRIERESQRQLETARGDIAAILLDAAEDLRRAVESQTEDAKALGEGVRLIADGFHRKLKQMGLEKIETVGKPFDPLVHEAVDLVPVEEASRDGLVVEEARAGWRLGERVLRAARVRVARHLPPQEEAPSEPGGEA